MATTRLYSFISMNLPADTFHVVSYTGQEEISRPYFFEIELVSEERDIRMEDVTEGSARFALIYRNMRLYYQGLVYRFEHLRSVDRHHYYKALLAPRLWALAMNRHSQVFLDKTVPEILEQVLLDTGVLSALDVDFRLSADYPRREYVCQYNESHFDFFSRWCEREGIYYFFEQEEHGERLVLTDTFMAHATLPRQPVLRYRPVSGLDSGSAIQIATSFVCEQNLVPQSVQLRDYNYRHASLNMDSGVAAVEQGDLGAVYSYGENVKSIDEAKHLAKVRAEEARAGQTLFKGVGRAPFVRAGFLFTLADHPDETRNDDYLVTKVTRHGCQYYYLTAALGLSEPEEKSEVAHSASFTAIKANVQYRPARATPWPRIYGAMNATVEAEGPKHYAYLDDQGRYKIRLPFDVSGTPLGKASAWVRMGQPYGGSGHGMHFPLLHGTEVLLTFIDGDVDRPVITAALPNVENQSVVKNTNSPANAIRSAAGNQLVFGDTKGQEFVGLFSSHAKSGISLGSHKPGGGGSVAISSHGVFDTFSGGGTIDCTLGSATSLVAGIQSEVSVGLKAEVSAAIAAEATLISEVSYTRGDRISLGTEDLTLAEQVEIAALDKVVLGAGTGVIVKELITRAKKALGLGIAASVAGGVGVAAISRPFDDSFLKDAKVEWNKSASWAMGGIATFAGLSLATICAIATRRVAKTFEKYTEKPTAATLTLDKLGANLAIDSSVSEPAILKLGVGPKADDTSFLEIGPSGNGITVGNKQNILKLLNGATISAIVKDAELQEKSRLELASEEIYTKVTGGGSMTVTKTSGVLTFGTGTTSGALTAKADEALVACGESNSLSVKTTGATMSAAAVSITATGSLTMNGVSINIG